MEIMLKREYKSRYRTDGNNIIEEDKSEYIECPKCKLIDNIYYYGRPMHEYKRKKYSYNFKIECNCGNVFFKGPYTNGKLIIMDRNGQIQGEYDFTGCITSES